MKAGVLSGTANLEHPASKIPAGNIAPHTIPDKKHSLFGRAALTYAGRGWHAFRLVTRAKLPLKGSHGHLDATKDPEQIRRWWDETPSANVGIRTGAESNLVVIEIDPRNGGDDSLRDLEAEYGPLPETVRALSGRGDGGTHHYFLHPGGRIKSGADRLGPGIDVKADGAYVVAPPSIHPATGQPYTWDAGAHPADIRPAELPAWVLAKLTAQPKHTRAADPETDDWTIPEGQRNAGLTSIAGKLRRQAFNEAEIAALLLVANQHRCRPPLPDNEVRNIAASVAKYPPNAVPDFSEEAEREERREADRLREVMTARHDFDKWTARATPPYEDKDSLRPTNPSQLTPAQKDIACTIARTLPTLPRNERGEAQMGPIYIAPRAGCSRNTATAFYQTLAEAGIWTVRTEDYQNEKGEIRKRTYVRLADDIENGEAAILDAIAAAGIKPKPRGGPRTKTIILRSALVEALTCPDCGDAGAETQATTFCTRCGSAVYDHPAIEHPAGWLAEEPPEPPPFIGEDGSPDPESVPDAQRQDRKEDDLLRVHCEHQPPADEPPMLNFEHRNGSHNHAIDAEDGTDDPLSVFGPLGDEDPDEEAELSPVVEDQLWGISGQAVPGHLVPNTTACARCGTALAEGQRFLCSPCGEQDQARVFREALSTATTPAARILIHGQRLNWARTPLRPPDVIPAGEAAWRRWVAAPENAEVLEAADRLLAERLGVGP